HNIRNGASVGIACYPASAKTQEDLILNADVAMYHAKASGRNNYQHFTDELNERYKKQLNLEHALKFALEKKELFLTYQPIYDLKTRNIIGIETLLCWDHPKFGLVSPNIFIPIAEETGLIIDIGNWILRTACHQASLWPLDKIKNFKFAINISSRQLLRENFVQQLITILNDTGMSPSLLEIELTETVMMTYTTGSFKEEIMKIHDLGINISIDDFGTGYSSLTRLKHLPVNTLKIEKSFIQEAVINPNSGIIVSCLIALGKNLGLNVIAEGIENEEQLKFLTAKGCPQGQGFYLSKPLSVDRMEKLLKLQVKSKSEKESPV
ncbi:MAG: GGDEF domain-containing protein, partial [Gammaproteobacteria bacterium]